MEEGVRSREDRSGGGIEEGGDQIWEEGVEQFYVMNKEAGCGGK
jgi:hypothetical protein